MSDALTGTMASIAVIFAVTAAAATAAAVGIGAGKLETCIVFGGVTAYNISEQSSRPEFIMMTLGTARTIIENRRHHKHCSTWQTWLFACRT